MIPFLENTIINIFKNNYTKIKKLFWNIKVNLKILIIIYIEILNQPKKIKKITVQDFKENKKATDDDSNVLYNIFIIHIICI
jgi:hypothetical protein